MTASATYNKVLGGDASWGNWETTAAWGRNKWDEPVPDPLGAVSGHVHFTPGVQPTRNAVLAETGLRFKGLHTVFATVGVGGEGRALHHRGSAPPARLQHTEAQRRLPHRFLASAPRAHRSWSVRLGALASRRPVVRLRRAADVVRVLLPAEDHLTPPLSKPAANSGSMSSWWPTNSNPLSVSRHRALHDVDARTVVADEIEVRRGEIRERMAEVAHDADRFQEHFGQATPRSRRSNTRRRR